MEDNQAGNMEHGGRSARGSEGAGILIGSQHGSAAGSDPAGLMTPAPTVDLGAVTAAAVAFGTSPTRRRASETGSPLLDAERRRRTEQATAGERLPGRDATRSPRPVTPPARTSAAPPGSAAPASPDWHQDLPGHDTSLEELRGFVLREIGKLHANARSQAERSHATRVDLEILKKTMEGKADFDVVKSAFDEEHAIFNTKIGMINEGMNDFGGKVMKAFSSVEAIETNLQQHVTGSFAEVVAGVKWLDVVT